MPSYDENGNLVGEELYVNDEYVIENGVTEFLYDFDYIMCVMQNAQFPNLVLTTPFIDIAAVESIEADDIRSSVKVEGHNVIVSTSAPNAAIYSINGSLIGSAKTIDGTAQFSNIATGAYIVIAGRQAAKILVK